MGEQVTAAEEEEAAAGARKRKRGGEGAGEEVDVDEVEIDQKEKDGYGGGGWFEKKGGLLLKDADDGADCYEEEAVAEVMRWLEADVFSEQQRCAPEDPAAGGFVTINGNEESCGPSFSCAASTVMASVDTRARAPPPPPLPWPFPESESELVMKREEAPKKDAEMVVADDDDDAWLTDLLLACGPALELQGV